MNKDIVNQIEQELKAKGLLETQSSSQPIDLKQALEELASTGKLISAWEPTARGIGSGLKLKVLTKLKNVVVNILNPYARKQEQYNQILARAVIELLKNSK